MTLPERLKQVRESLGKNQKEMALLLDISKAAWQGYEAGDNIPGGQVFESIVKLGFNGTWLLTGEGEMRRGGKRHDEKNLVVSEPVSVYNAGDLELKEINEWLREHPQDKKLFIKAIKAKKELKEALEALARG